MSARVTTAPDTGGPSVRRTVPKTVSVSRSAVFSTMDALPPIHGYSGGRREGLEGGQCGLKGRPLGRRQLVDPVGEGAGGAPAQLFQQLGPLGTGGEQADPAVVR